MRKAVRQVIAQTCEDWEFVYVNDGPSRQSRQLFQKLAGSDGRLRYMETGQEYNDWGWTPRNEAVQELARSASPPDYLVMWDDDDLVVPEALELIRDEIERCGQPALLVVPVRQGRDAVPRKAASVEDITPGDFLSLNIVLRFDYAARFLPETTGREGCRGGDFLLLDRVRGIPGVRKVFSQMPPIGVYDGHRTMMMLRWRLGIPILGLERIPVVRAVRKWLRG